MCSFRMNNGRGVAMGKMGVCGSSRSEAVRSGEKSESRSACRAYWETGDESLTCKKSELRETRMPPTLLPFF